MLSKVLKILPAFAALLVMAVPVGCAEKKLVADKKPAVEKKGAPKMGWKMTMKVVYFGRMEWYVSADGARLTSPIIAILVRPPGFNTQMFNTETKKVKTFTKSQGFDRLSMMMNSSMGAPKDKFIYSKWKKVGNEVVAGRPCVKYVRELLNSKQDKTHYSQLTENCWMTPMFDIPHFKELMEPLSRLTRKDDTALPGLCLRVKSTWKIFRRGNPVPEVDRPSTPMDTISCVQVPIDPSIFVFGKDYTPVQDEGEILFSDEGGGMPGHF